MLVGIRRPRNISSQHFKYICELQKNIDAWVPKTKSLSNTCVEFSRDGTVDKVRSLAAAGVRVIGKQI